MTMKNCCLIFLLVLFPLFGQSQSSEIKSCFLPDDKEMTKKIAIADALIWAGSDTLMVKCSNGESYRLNTFQVSMLTLKPFQTKEFGIGELGVPILARNAIKNARAGDTVYLKKVTALNKSHEVVAIPDVILILQ